MDNATPRGPYAAAHEAVLHRSPEELAARLAPRIEAALGGDDHVIAVLDDTHRDALRETLGADAASVTFPDPAAVHSVPGFTVAARWARTARARSGALIIGQHVESLPVAEPAYWARLDIALNVAISGLPVTVLCPYRVDSPELPRVLATHPMINGVDGPARSPSFRAPPEALIDFPPPPPPDLGPPIARMAFAASTLAGVRRLTERVGEAAGLSDERVADLVLAVNEIASNSIEHGPGSGVLRFWTGADLVAEVTDDGAGLTIPFPGIALPPPEGVRGRGLWLASELCDVLQVWSDAGSTVIRMAMHP
ncbi:ATP-binding protein [Actinomycetes bacterium KLBMP 9759]